MSYPLPLVTPVPPGSWRRALAMALPALAIGVAGMLFSERFPIEKSGDGLIYAQLTANAPHLIGHGFVDGYYVRRALPPLLVRGAMLLTGQPLGLAQIEQAFYLLNIVALTALGALWSLCADMVRLSRIGRWVGFAALFLNVATLKWLLYYPLLLDATAYALGIAMLCAYLARRDVALLALTAAGAFCWPTLLWIGLALYLLPRPEPLAPERAPIRLPAAWAWGAVAGLLLAIAAPLYGAFNAAGMQRLIPLGVVGIALYGFAVTAGLVRRADLRWLLDQADWRGFSRLVVAAVLWFAVARLTSDYASHTAPTNDNQVFLRAALWLSLSTPLGFVVAHVAFYGPVLLVLIRYWRPALDLLALAGPGLAVAVALAALVAVSPESRQIINFHPILVLIAVKALDAARLGWRFLLCFGGASLVLSLAWLPFNHPALLPYRQATEGWQTLAAIQGHTMSMTSYLAWLVALAATGWLLYRALPRREMRA